MKPRILFLYTELAEYTVACMRYAIEHNGVEIHVVRYPVNAEAPFQFDFSGIQLYERKDFSRTELLDLVKLIQPQAIVCSGWIDKDYVAVCKAFKNQISTVVALDNAWTGKLKQRIATLLSPILIKNAFSHAWVPGELQKKYALILGFPEEKIQTGFYSTDTAYFTALGDKYAEEKKGNFPKRFIYVGRYVEHKGIFELWEAYKRLRAEVTTDWELWCLGTGDAYTRRVEHEGIKHFGFVQPAEMEEFIRNTGVFILPSHFEPWGVVVHEFAAAGFPLLLSEKVGAKTSFVKENDNGFIFKDRNPDSIFKAMQKIVNLPLEGFVKMGEESKRLAQQLSPQSWASSLIKFL